MVDTLCPKSEAMHVALSIKVREETTYKLKGKLQHIPGEKNIISDLLSHNRIHEAVQLLRSKCLGRCFTIGAFSLLHIGFLEAAMLCNK